MIISSKFQVLSFEGVLQYEPNSFSLFFFLTIYYILDTWY